jgi:hypothetical protein
MEGGRERGAGGGWRDVGSPSCLSPGSWRLGLQGLNSIQDCDLNSIFDSCSDGLTSYFIFLNFIYKDPGEIKPKTLEFQSPSPLVLALHSQVDNRATAPGLARRRPRHCGRGARRLGRRCTAAAARPAGVSDS